MKQTLQVKLGQQLTMTPQLQQAIRLLQLSTIELQAEIQEMLDSNPMLEELEEAESNNQSSEETRTDDTPTPQEDQEPGNQEDSLSQIEKDTLPEDMPVDSNWDDYYDAPAASLSESGHRGTGEDVQFDTFQATSEDLHSHLEWQLNLTPMTDRDRFIAHSLIDAVDNDGLIHQEPETLFQGICQQWAQEASGADNEPVEQDECQAVLHRIQQFDPPGVAATSLQDCLLIQLNQLHIDTPWLLDARLIIEEHLDLLAAHDYKTLMRKSGIRENTLKEALKLIHSLNPTPGNIIDSGDTEYVVPDVYVTRETNQWRVSLNPDIAPRLSINHYYSSLIDSRQAQADAAYLKNNLQEARWFIKSLESRNETLLKVAKAIVQMQRSFLEYGPEAMKPMVLHDIADAVDMHESTISRVTTQKYMHTPMGIFELKYFFSSSVSTEGGGSCSSTAIRALIRKLVDAEAPAKPLSDSKIATLLDEQGIKVARRTVAKYRESLHIPPSNERKKLA
jgi:RNA polymerase sigma-54 factor